MPNSSVADLNKILVGCAQKDREYAKIRTTAILFDISRTELCQLIAEDKIKAFHYCKPGKKKGVRLILLSSLRAYLKEAATRPPVEKTIPPRRNKAKSVMAK